MNDDHPILHDTDRILPVNNAGRSRESKSKRASETCMQQLMNSFARSGVGDRVQYIPQGAAERQRRLGVVDRTTRR